MGLLCRRGRRTAICAGALAIAAALSTTPSVAAAGPELNGSQTVTPVTSPHDPSTLTPLRDGAGSLTDAGITVDASLRTTPERYTPGEPLDIRVTGTLDINAMTNAVCHGLELTVMRGAIRLGGRLSSPDRSPIIAGETRVEPINLGYDVPADDVPASGNINVDIALRCSPIVDGTWEFPGQSSVVATAKIRVANGAVAVSPGWVFPDADYAQKARVTAQTTGGKSTVRVKRGSKTIWAKKTSKARINLAIPSSKLSKSGTYSVLVRNGGKTVRTTFRVSKGWAPLMSEPAHWERCSTITWVYDDGLAPRGGDKQLVEDLTSTFDIYERLTGLRFVRVKKGSADFVVDWADLPGQADGWGGASGYAGILSGGSLTLSTTSRWAKTPGDGVDGRGALLNHEVAHTLGLGHVTNDRELMFPIHTVGVSPLVPQQGDISGLRELYSPSTCP